MDEFLFELGRVVATPGVLKALAESNESPTSYIARHVFGDFGTVCKEDIRANRDAIRHGARIVSAYDLPNGQPIYLITEADRSATTLMLKSEY